MPKDFKRFRDKNLMSKLPDDPEAVIQIGTACMVKAWFIASDSTGMDDTVVVEGHLANGKTYKITVDVK